MPNGNATHPTPAPDSPEERVRLRNGAVLAPVIATLVGLSALAVSLFLGLRCADGGRRFLHAYLLSVVFFTSLALGALFFVVLQHLTKAGWSVAVRRVAELLAAAMPLLALLFIPVLVAVHRGSDVLYTWVSPDVVGSDPLLQNKAPYLNAPFFVARCAGYFLLWTLLARFFLRRSVAQDESGDPRLTLTMERLAPPAMILFAVTVTFASFDWLMSLDAHWLSTLFGVYFFAGSAVGSFALLVLSCLWLRWRGVACRSITVEHYHDMGKLLFAFVFFWGYIAFSQYLIIWYADIPEETVWFRNRQHGGWQWMSLLLVVGHFVIPFLALISRHAKRRLGVLGFWSVVMLLMHWVDLYWVIMPSYDSSRVPFHLLDITVLLGVGGLFFAAVGVAAYGKRLVPINDPRLDEALAFQNT